MKLLRVDGDSALSRDMQELGVHHILLSISFPENFPFQPPFLRVLSPRLEKVRSPSRCHFVYTLNMKNSSITFHLTSLILLPPQGFVLEGGAICMELLTPRGWASAYTVEAVIMQFAAALVKGQVGGVKGQVGGVKGQVGGVKGQVGGVKGQVGGVKGQVGGVKGQVGRVMGQVGGAKDQVGGVKGKCSMGGAIKWCKSIRTCSVRYTVYYFYYYYL